MKDPPLIEADTTPRIVQRERGGERKRERKMKPIKLRKSW